MPTSARPAALPCAGRTPLGACLLVAAASGLGAGLLPAQEAPLPPLFASDEPLTLVLTTDLLVLDGDRRDGAPWRPASLTVPRANGRGRVTLDAEVRTRGNYRLNVCAMPPIRVRVDEERAGGTAFAGQGSLKLVSSCQPGRSGFEQLVLGEYLAYRAYAHLTDRSLRVRLARITFVDQAGFRDPDTRWGFFIEDEDDLAERMGGEIFELPEGKNLPVGALEPLAAARTAMFEYMIGNADWSDVAAHNVEIVEVGGAVPVPYDFDSSGLVEAPYAIPPAELGVRSVTERIYRGWCWSPAVTASVLQAFRDAQGPILALFEGFEPLEEATRARMLSYLREFFEAIETDERAERRFLRDCRTPD